MLDKVDRSKPLGVHRRGYWFCASQRSVCEPVEAPCAESGALADSVAVTR
jgi:hypothetical protein